jgi:sec-independent protein translocase protein TatA
MGISLMGSVSIWHWIVVGIVIMLLFGRGKVSELMGDVAKGIKAFKKGMSEEEQQAQATAADAQKNLDSQPATTVKTEAEKKV